MAESDRSKKTKSILIFFPEIKIRKYDDNNNTTTESSQASTSDSNDETKSNTPTESSQVQTSVSNNEKKSAPKRTFQANWLREFSWFLFTVQSFVNMLTSV